jgi:REP element-mobilizing transposase RayT
MSRSLRLEYAGALYHITARGNERKKIYFAQRDYAKFKEYLLQAKERFGVLIHAYVLMGNHYHLVMETPEPNLSRVMHFINGSYTTFINAKRKRSGHLLQGRYKSILVDRDNYLLELSRYIHLNPLRAGIADRPESYQHSSYHHYIEGTEDPVVTSGVIHAMLADQPQVAGERYRSFVENAIGREAESPLGDVYGGLVLGNERFIRTTLARLKHRHLDEEEIPGRRALRAKVSATEILEGVSGHFCQTPDGLIQANSGPPRRRYAIYFLKHYAGVTSREVGDLFSGMSCAAVAKSYQRFVRQLATDRVLREDVMRCWEKMSHVQV